MAEVVVRGDRLATRAPAKINLVLEVDGVRPDGYHELRSVFAPLALADDLSVRVGTLRPGAPPRDELVVTGGSGLETADNLVLRAAALLRAEADRPLAPLAFRLRKRIPVAAGLGGGSSDALAALDLAAVAWGLRIPARRRPELAAQLGSDVPFFALGSWALVSGRGERLRRLPPPRGGPLGVLLVVPDAHLSTPEVFAALDAGRKAGGWARLPKCMTTDRSAETASAAGPIGARPGAAAALASELRRGMTRAGLALIEPANDLLPVAAGLLPGLEPLRRELVALLERPVHLSGSGPALLVLYPSLRGARRASALVRSAAERGRLTGPGRGLRIVATATTGGSG